MFRIASDDLYLQEQLPPGRLHGPRDPPPGLHQLGAGRADGPAAAAAGAAGALGRLPLLAAVSDPADARHAAGNHMFRFLN